MILMPYRRIYNLSTEEYTIKRATVKLTLALATLLFSCTFFVFLLFETADAAQRANSEQLVSLL
jgi:hypothetical protein